MSCTCNDVLSSKYESFSAFSVRHQRLLAMGVDNQKYLGVGEVKSMGLVNELAKVFCIRVVLLFAAPWLL